MVKVIQRASYDIVLVHFHLQFFRPLLRQFGPVQALVRHLDVRLAPSVARSKDVSGPSVLTLYISISLMLSKTRCISCSCVDTKSDSKGKAFETFPLVKREDALFTVQPCNTVFPDIAAAAFINFKLL